MKVAIAGTGIAYEHGERLRTMNDVQLTGLWGRTREKVIEKAGALNCPALFEYDELLAHGDPDLIIVAVPTDLHEQYVTEALNAGKHVFCETPLAYNSIEAERMTVKAADSGKTLSVGLFQNFNNPFRWLADQSSEAPFESINIYRRTAPVWGKMRHIVLDLMLHDIDSVVSIAGIPGHVSARGKKDSSGDWNQVTIDLAYSGGTIRIEGDSALPMGFPFSAGFFARRTQSGKSLAADFRLSFPKSGFDFVFKIWNDEGELEHQVTGLDPYYAELSYLVEKLTNGELPELVSAHRALSAIQIAEKAVSLLEEDKV